MQLGHVAIVGTGGLLGEIISSELQVFADVTEVPDHLALAEYSTPYPNAIITWSTASEIGELRTRLQRVFPVDVDPLLVVLSQIDPTIYFTRLRTLCVERLRLGFDELFEELAGRIAGHTRGTTPACAGIA